MITEDAKNKLLKIRQMLKDNAPYVYQKFANHKLYGKEEKKEVEKPALINDRGLT